MINTFKVLIIGHGNPVLMNCNCNLLFNDLNTDIFLLSKESSGCVVWVGPKLVYTYTTIIIEYSMIHNVFDVRNQTTTRMSLLFKKNNNKKNLQSYINLKLSLVFFVQMRCMYGNVAFQKTYSFADARLQICL